MDQQDYYLSFESRVIEPLVNLQHTIRQSITKRIMQMVLLVLIGMIIVGCKRRDVRLRADAIADRASAAVLEANDVTTIISDSGIIRYRIKAKTWKVFDKADKLMGK